MRNKKRPALTPEKIEQFKQRLNEKKAEMEKARADLKAEDPLLQPGRERESNEAVDDAYEMSGHDQVMVQRAELSKMLLQIGKALVRMKEGAYGLCEKCDLAIDTARLEVYPEATLCVKCERREE